MFRITVVVLLATLYAPLLQSAEFPIDLRDIADPGLRKFLKTARRETANPFEAGDFDERLRRLIAQLGDSDAKVRDAAESQLLKLGGVARLALESAKGGENTDIAAGARRLLEKLPDLTHIVTDATGHFIPRAKVILKLVGSKDDKPPVDETITVYTDDSGRFTLPVFRVRNYNMTAQLNHLQFDCGQCRVDWLAGNLRFPVVRRDSDLYSRAVKGVVNGKDGKPVVGATIQCSHVRTPGEGLIDQAYPCGCAVTDLEGRFTYYFPTGQKNGEHKRERGEQIPVNSRYALSIAVPGDQTFFPVTGMYANIEPVRITLPHAERFHRFYFEAPGGGLLETREQFANARVQYESGQTGQIRLAPLNPEVAWKGRKLIPGTYRATAFVGGKALDYRPLIVKVDSPEDLYFQLQPAVVYEGRVVDGVTGAPVPEAFLMGWSSTSRNNLALLTDDDWEMLQDTPSRPAPDHPAMVKLREFYGVQELVRTDEEGRFEITQRPEQEFYGLMAFGKNFVPFKKRLYSIEKNRSNIVDVGEFPLFPSAKVLVRPVCSGKRLSVMPQWLPIDEGQPDWIDRFHDACDGSKQEFEYVHWLRLNELQPVFVPADVRLRLRFQCRYDDQWSPHTCETLIQLKAGETQLIGDIDFTPSLSAIVRVMDKTGRPVEGIPVRRMHHEERGWSVAHNTDKDGRAFFYVYPDSTGQFGILDIHGARDGKMPANLFADFKVGRDSPKAEFQITLTDGQIRRLLGARAE